MEVTRSLPAETQHPRCYLTLTAIEVGQLPKQQVHTAPSLAPGHVGTVVWYTEGEVRGYIVEVNFQRGAPQYFLLPCTSPPVFGIDQFDGHRMQDAEAYAVSLRCHWKSDQLDVFEGKDTVDTRVYLQRREIASAPNDASMSAAAQNVAFAEAASIVMQKLQKGGEVSAAERASLNKANESFAQILKAAPRNSSAMYFSGKAFELLGQLEMALSLFIRAAETTPEQTQFSIDAAMLAVRVGRGGDAVRFARQALNCSPADPELMSNLAFAAHCGGRERGRRNELTSPEGESSIAGDHKAGEQSLSRRGRQKISATENEAETIALMKKLKA